MAKFRSSFSTKPKRNFLERTILHNQRNTAMRLVSPITNLAHWIGFLWGEMDTGGEISDRKQGLKSPNSYIIVGSLDEIWDDKK